MMKGRKRMVLWERTEETQESPSRRPISTLDKQGGAKLWKTLMDRLRTLNLICLKNGVTLWFNIKHDLRRFFWQITKQNVLRFKGLGLLKKKRTLQYLPNTALWIQQAFKKCEILKMNTLQHNMHIGIAPKWMSN